jgi:DNA topoisomerase VI subunit A
MQVYRAGSIKRPRRTKAHIAAIRAAIKDVLESDHPQIIRQIYYALVVKGVIEKTEQEYQHTVIRLCSEMRWQNEIDWDWIIDESRVIHETQTFDSLVDAADHAARFYRRSALRDCADHLEIWCEKAGLGSIIWEEASDYDVPVIVTKGMPSLTQLYDCFRRSVRAARAGKQTYIYQFGDHDPSGCLIPQVIEDRINKLCERWDCPSPYIKRIALTKEQIRRYRLPTRPTKRRGNSHAKNFEGNSVELDALPARALRDLVTECIEQHISAETLNALRAAEESEREVLVKLGRKLSKERRGAHR